MDPPPKYPAQTARLYLQPLSAESHLEAYHALYSDPASLAFSTQTPKSSIAESRTSLLSRLRSDEQPWVEIYAILLRPQPTVSDPQPSLEKESQVGDKEETPRFIGLVGANRLSPPPLLRPELGYRLHPDFFGKGYATEALGAFLKLYWSLPERMNVSQIQAVVDVNNPASGRVMEKMGATRGDRLMMDLGRLGTCEMETWILDRPRREQKEIGTGE